VKTKKPTLKQKMAEADAMSSREGSLLDAYTTAPPPTPTPQSAAPPVTPSVPAKPVPVASTHMPPSSLSLHTTPASQLPVSSPMISSASSSFSPVSIPVTPPSSSKPETDDEWDSTAEKMSGEPVKLPPRSLRPMGGALGRKLNEGPKTMAEKTRVSYTKDELLKLRPTTPIEKPVGFNWYNSLIRADGDGTISRIAGSRDGRQQQQQQAVGMDSQQRWQKSAPPGYQSTSPSQQLERTNYDPVGQGQGSVQNMYNQGFMPGIAGAPPGMPPPGVAQTGQGSWQRGLAQQLPPPVQQQVPIRPKARPVPTVMPKKVISDPLEILTRDVQAVLNKITPQTFAKLTTQLCEIPIDTNAMLDRLIYLVFEKAIQEPSFANLYADMCSSLENQSRYWAFLQVAFNKDSNQYIWMKDLTFDKDLAGPYSSSKECVSTVLKESPPALHPITVKVQVHEVIITSGILVKVFKNVESEEYFVSFLPYDEVDSSMISTKAFPTQQAAEKDATNENSFRRRLVHLCQDEFFASVNIEGKYKEIEELRQNFEAETSNMSEEERGYQLADLEDQERKMKRRMLGNMRFIGELYKKSLLKSGIMYDCFTHIVERKPMKDEDIELLCKLLHTVGSTLESKSNSKKSKDVEDRKRLDDLFDTISKMAADKSLNSRMRFSLEEVLSLRQNHWQSRREQEGPATLEEIHEKIAREENMKKMQSQQALLPPQGAPKRFGYNQPEPDMRYQPSEPQQIQQQSYQYNSYGRGQVQTQSQGSYMGRGGGREFSRMASIGPGAGVGPSAGTVPMRRDNFAPYPGSEFGRGGRTMSEPQHRRGGSGSFPGGTGGFVSSGLSSSPIGTTGDDRVQKEVKSVLVELSVTNDVKEAGTLLSPVTAVVAFELTRALLQKILNSKFRADWEILFSLLNHLSPRLFAHGDHIEQALLTCDDVQQLPDTLLDYQQAPECIGALVGCLVRHKICRREAFETQFNIRKDQLLHDDLADRDAVTSAYDRLFIALNKNFA